MRLHERCGRTTKAGKPCGKGFTIVGGVWGPACRDHITDDEMATLNAEAQRLAQTVAAGPAPADTTACAS